MDHELVVFVAESLLCVIDVAILEIPGRTSVWVWTSSENRLVPAIALELPQIGS